MDKFRACILCSWIAAFQINALTQVITRRTKLTNTPVGDSGGQLRTRVVNTSIGEAFGAFSCREARRCWSLYSQNFSRQKILSPRRRPGPNFRQCITCLKNLDSGLRRDDRVFWSSPVLRAPNNELHTSCFKQYTTIEEPLRRELH